MPKRKMADSWGQLAKAMGVHVVTISRWRKHAHWPAKWKKPPVDPAKVKEWRDKHVVAMSDRGVTQASFRPPDEPPVDNGTNGMLDPTAIHARFKVEQLLTARIKREKMQGDLIARELHCRAFVAMISDFLDDLEALWRTMPELMEGMSVGEMRAYLQNWTDGLRNRYAGARTVRLATDPELELMGVALESISRADKPGRPRQKHRAGQLSPKSRDLGAKRVNGQAASN